MQFMIVAIMQPYFFPYLGYFSLIAQSDVFVLHDDVQYIKGGWINRNRILSAGAARWITLPVLRASYDQPINRRRYQLTAGNITKLLRQLEAAYVRAPRFADVFSLCRAILGFEDANVAAFNSNLLTRVAAEIGIDTRFLHSSQIEKDCRLSGQDRVIEICRRLGASRYINPIGGMNLYDGRRFAEAGLQLSFLHSDPPNYRQFGDLHIASLSVIDALMFNDPRAMNRSVRSSRLIDAADLCHEAV